MKQADRMSLCGYFIKIFSVFFPVHWLSAAVCQGYSTNSWHKTSEYRWLIILLPVEWCVKVLFWERGPMQLTNHTQTGYQERWIIVLSHSNFSCSKWALNLMSRNVYVCIHLFVSLSQFLCLLWCMCKEIHTYMT